MEIWKILMIKLVIYWASTKICYMEGLLLVFTLKQKIGRIVKR